MSKNFKKKNFWDNFRFEFVLYINEQKKIDKGEQPPIICQRLFDVKNYNEDALNSMEIKELMDSITGMNNGAIGDLGIIPNHFKKLCKLSSWKGYNPYRIYENDNRDRKSLFENEDIFTFEIKVDKKVVAKSQFSGNFFQTDVRYAVNIRDIIPKIISEVEEYFSRDEYTVMYEGTPLEFEVAPYDFKV